MADKYDSFAELAAGETEGIDFRICLTKRDSPVAIIAPHGGKIEPATSEIAASIAADRFSIYCFEGIKRGGENRDLHVTSARFDEPTGVELVTRSEFVVAVHGRLDRMDAKTFWLGGRDTALRDAIGEAMRPYFDATSAAGELTGLDLANICNRGLTKAGVQLEIPRTLRDALIEDEALRDRFGAAVRGAIERHLAMKSEVPSPT